MDKKDKKFYRQLIPFAAALLGIQLMLQFGTELELHPWTPYIHLYHLVLTVVAYRMISIGVKKEPGYFMQYFYGHTTIRLLLSAVLLAAYILGIKEGKVSFAITFMVFYFCYAVFEINGLLSKLRENSAQNT